ncbi:LysR family transcriptional regulator [Vibrio lamellibrachiae]|uniref:LysR family transcriptional regulator n=1 Tax=Vibrio lamellibrachiae TaxID=2910253 RepID=UPI003D0C4CEF
MRPFHQLDLNLLKVFKVLSEELHTGRAAERLHIAQPSVSRSLARLRDHFEDPLFVKTRDGLTPTSMAARLALVIPNTLNQLSDSIDSLETFDITQKSGQLRIAVNSFLALTLPAKLHLKLQSVAPDIQLEVENWGSSTVNKLIKGELDFAINYYPLDVPKEIISHPLTVDRFQLLVRNDHPLIGKKSTIDELAIYPWVTAIVKGWNEQTTLVSRLLADKNVPIQMNYRSEVFSSVVQVTAESDAILPCSALLSENLFPQLTSIDVPDSIESPSEEVRIYAHQRLRHDPYHEFLFLVIKDIVGRL